MKNMVKGKTILITGGAGFIGSHLCEKYCQEGHTVICLDNFMNGNLANVRQLLNQRNFKLIDGDIRDLDLLEKIMPGVNVVFHLAAQIHVDRSMVEPGLTYEVNVLGTQNILEASRRYDIEKVIYASTSEVYGPAEYVPMDENHPLKAPHIYGASKIAADRMCYAYIQTYAMNVYILRSFNTFGPRQKDTGYGGAISMFLKRVLSGMPPIIYGDGHQTRDYIYIDDIVRAYDSVFSYEKPIAGPINFGTGREVRIVDLANMIVDLCDGKSDVRPVHVETRPGEVQRLVADTTMAKNLLKWEPQYSLEDGLNILIDWYKKYKFEQWSKLG